MRMTPREYSVCSIIHLYHYMYDKTIHMTLFLTIPLVENRNKEMSWSLYFLIPASITIILSGIFEMLALFLLNSINMIYVIVIGTLIVAVYTISLCKIATKKQPPVASAATPKYESSSHEEMMSAREYVRKSYAAMR